MEINNLYRAELTKNIHHKLTYIVLIVSIVIEISVMFAIAPNGSSKEASGWIVDNFSFPGSLNWVPLVATPMAWLVLPVMVANIIGIDYDLRTWNIILPRARYRWLTLIAKLMATTSILIGWLLVMLIIALLFGAIYSKMVGVSVFANRDSQFYFECCNSWVKMFATIACYGAIVFVFTIFFKSIVSGTLISFLTIMSFMFISRFGSDFFALLTPLQHFDNLLSRPLGDGVTIDFTRVQFPVWGSWGVILSYIVICLSISFFLFQKQDISE